jgi:acyl-[acyl carrier protein]--UDP-N-acetylglucosamine O-acyltransferase
VIVQGDRARVRALNVVGLERRGVDPASMVALRQAFAQLFVQRTIPRARVLADLDARDPFVVALVAALR